MNRRDRRRVDYYVRAFRGQRRQVLNPWSRILGIIVKEVGVAYDCDVNYDPERTVSQMLEALGLVKWTRQPGLPATPSIVGGWNEMIETLTALDARARLIGFAPAVSEARETMKATDARLRLENTE